MIHLQLDWIVVWYDYLYLLTFIYDSFHCDIFPLLTIITDLNLGWHIYVEFLNQALNKTM